MPEYRYKIKYLIQNVLDTCDEDGYPLYWSNEFGWTKLTSADWYETKFHELPMDGKWVEVNCAI